MTFILGTNLKNISFILQGLIPALQDVMPGVEHHFCVLHLWKNFTKQWRDKELRGLLWECAKATTQPEFKATMDKVKVKNDAAWEYLHKVPPHSWTKAHFSEECKVDTLCNNKCEVFNGKIVKFRGLPILKLIDEIKDYIAKTMTQRKKDLKTMSSKLVPVQ